MNGPIIEMAGFAQNRISVTMQANPAGRSFAVDGMTYTTSQTFSWLPGSGHTVAATSPQAGGTGVQFAWSSWSDGWAISHTVAPTTSTSYSVNFTTQYYLTTVAGTGGTINPSSGWFNGGASVPITGNALPGYSFDGWIGSGAGSYSGISSSTSITMSGPIAETGNFAIISPPLLGMLRQGDKVLLSWPTNSVGYTLEYATDLPATSWTSNTTAPAIVGVNYTATNTMSGPTRFFRLRKL